MCLSPSDDVVEYVEDMPHYSVSEARSRFSAGWCIWTLASALGLATSKYVLVTSNYHYPLHLLLLHLLLAAAGVSCRPIRHAGRLRLLYIGPRPTMLLRAWRNKSNNELLAVVFAAVSLPMSMQACLHLWSLSTLCMVANLGIAVEAMVVCAKTRASFNLKAATSSLLAVLTCAALLYDEYRLDVNGLLFGIPAVLLAGTAKGLFTLDAITNDYRHPGAGAGPSLTIQLVLSLSFFITLLWAIIVEKTFTGGRIFADLAHVRVASIALNLASSPMALVFGGSLLCRLPVHVPSYGGKSTSFAARSLFSSIFAPALTLISTLFAIVLLTRSYTTIIQYAAYVLLCLSAAGFSHQVMVALDQGVEFSQKQPDSLTNGSPAGGHRRRQSVDDRPIFIPHEDAFGGPTALRTVSAVLVLAIVGLSTWLTVNSGLFDLPTIKPPLHLDHTYHAVHEIDLIISMYKEPLSTIMKTVSSVRQIPAFRDSRLIIYVKDPKADINHIQSRTKADSVIAIPNVGREGETYLHHILERWDSLARHSFFMQAEVHNMREFIPRVRNYFDPKRTGMLSIGFVNNICDCEHCGDRFSWYDHGHVVSHLYRNVSRTETTCSRTPLSYKGQFIASARRIRGVDKSVYKGLWDLMVDPNSWAHQQPFLRGKEDRLDKPRFGYTIERTWNVLMQCADMNIAWKCPTLLSGWRRGGSVADCQCFDDVGGKG